MTQQTRDHLDGGAPGLPDRLNHGRLSRRDLLWLMAVSTGAVATTSLQGCAKSPVTGKSILVGMTEAQERSIDKEVAPHQFSQDLGPVQDDQTNAYVRSIGESMAVKTHRPGMPYNFRVLNANYVNAYTFPGGAMGLTRGIVTDMQNEAELAALLGHELGHVNARHAAQRQGKTMVAQAAVVGVNVAARDSQWGALAGILGQVGSSALLSSYSRDNEREADALGQEYMTRAGYPAEGMTDLHKLLVSKHSAEPSMLETMFSTHPMPKERVELAQHVAKTRYKPFAGAPVNKERYLDSTARIRSLKPTIKACQQGESAAARKKLPEAEGHFAKAIKFKKDDYAANVLMAKTLIAQKKTVEARRFADIAKAVYPQEAQAHKLAGVSRLASKDYDGAYAALSSFDKLLPGDPGVTFLKGVSLEGAGRKKEAAEQYYAYARDVRGGNASQYAVGRLKSWGYLK